MSITVTNPLTFERTVLNAPAKPMGIAKLHTAVAEANGEDNPAGISDQSLLLELVWDARVGLLKKAAQTLGITGKPTPAQLDKIRTVATSIVKDAIEDLLGEVIYAQDVNPDGCDRDAMGIPSVTRH